MANELAPNQHNHQNSSYPNCMENFAGDVLYGVDIKVNNFAQVWRRENASSAYTAINGNNNNIAKPALVYTEITGPTAGYTLTGIAGGVDGECRGFVNGVDSPMYVGHLSASSSAGNKIELTGGATIEPFSAIWLQYDSTANGGVGAWVETTMKVCRAARFRVVDMDATAISALDLPIQIVNDDHYSLAIGVDHNERLHVVGNMHAEEQNYIRSQSLAGNVWPPVWTVPAYQFASTGANRHTYNYFHRTEDGRLVWFFDQAPTLGDSLGRDIVGVYLPTGTGTTWLPVNGVGNGIVAASGRSTTGMTANRVYLGGMIITPENYISGWPERLHFFGIWRTRDQNANSQTQPFYIWMNVDDFGTDTEWSTVINVNQPMPIEWSNLLDNRVASATMNPVGMPEINRTFGLGIGFTLLGEPCVILQNGGYGGLSDDPDSPDGPMGVNPSYESRFICRFNAASALWQMEAIHTSAILGGSTGPTLARLVDDIKLISCGASKAFVFSNRGMDPTQSIAIRGGITGSLGFNVNVEPMTAKRKKILVSIPSGDEPRVWEIGHEYRVDAG
jgi:BNR repeat-containing family member